jgi:hypothetical protein
MIRRGKMVPNVVLDTYLFHLLVLKDTSFIGYSCMQDVVSVDDMVKEKHGDNMGGDVI